MPPNSTLATERPSPIGTWRNRPHRPPWSRFSTAHGLMVLSGLLTFVLVVSAMGGPEARLTVLAARGDIPAGAPLSRDILRQVELPADSDLARATVQLERLAGGEHVAARPIAAGELLRPSDLGAGPVSGADRLRAMSIPVKRERAVGGALRVGDLVDVVDVVEGTARWVVAGAQVIEVPKSASSRGIVREVGGTYHVVVEVSDEEALALAEALTHDSVSVVRSTGAKAPQTDIAMVGTSSPPSAQADGPAEQPSSPPVEDSSSSAPGS